MVGGRYVTGGDSKAGPLVSKKRWRVCGKNIDVSVIETN